ncbi:hypothetical protein [Actinophytocola sp.]|uniref:hypothetical protein n=1 Tax=Actinophytocola sp. TaxID=1872138 RepID=UPI003D6A6133
MRITTGVVLWAVAAAAATAVGLFAVGAIGSDLYGADAQKPLSQSEVDQRLAETTPPGRTTTSPRSSPPTTTTPPATTTSPATTTPPAKTAVIHSAGGTVWARCAPGGVEVLGSTPAQGFEVEPDDDARVNDHPKITFLAGEREIEVRLRCSGGTVTHTVEDDD